MLQQTRIRVAAVLGAAILGIGPAMAALAPVAHGQGQCEGPCPCGFQPESAVTPAISSSNFDPQGGDGGCGGTSGSSQGFSQGSGQGQSAGGTGSGPTIGAGGGESPPSPSATTFGPTPVATPAAAGSGTIIFSRGSGGINVSQHTHANVRAHNSNRAGNANGGRGGNASNHF